MVFVGAVIEGVPYSPERAASDIKLTGEDHSAIPTEWFRESKIGYDTVSV
jgi:hypothetical protein